MLAFAALVFAYRFGDQVVSSLINPFMIDQGVSKETIAIMKGAVGSSTALLGAVVGGWMMLRFSRRHALLFSGLTQAVAFALYVLVAMGIGGEALLWAATITEGVFSTLASVSLFALMMDASDPDHAGTDFTLLASFVNVVGAIAGVVAGVLGDHLGYAWTFGIGTVLAVAGCLVLVMYLDRRPTHARVAQVWR